MESTQQNARTESTRTRPIRQDGWTPRDDQLLAEVTLRHIREGSTQTKAFEEAGDLLNRTAGACAFRWATVVKHEYKSAVELAKRQSRDVKKRRLQSKRASAAQNLFQDGDAELDLDAVIQALKQFKQRDKHYRILLKEYQRLEEEIENLKSENKMLRAEIQEMGRRSMQQEEDYKTLLQIVNRARKMAVLDPEDKQEELASASNV